MGRGSRPSPDWSEEERAWSQGAPYAIGVDEAGRGPLAGPLTVAAVAVAPGFSAPWLPAVQDSKRLTARQRTLLAEGIGEAAQQPGRRLLWAVAEATVEEIDGWGLGAALAAAIQRALDVLEIPASLVLLDGLPMRRLHRPHRAIVAGDARCYSIAMASILAKVRRDQLMTDLDLSYPQYGFARHKGYATAAHRTALREYGPCPAHRRSFRPVRQQLGKAG